MFHKFKPQKPAMTRLSMEMDAMARALEKALCEGYTEIEICSSYEKCVNILNDIQAEIKYATKKKMNYSEILDHVMPRYTSNPNYRIGCLVKDRFLRIFS